MQTETLERPLTRAERLKRETRDLHERLDQSIMGHAAFSDRERYRRFVDMQYRFMAAIEPLYRDPSLRAVVPDLESRSRFVAVAADLADLSLPEPELTPVPIPERQALGWLYVAEGSNLGAAFLYKAALKMGFDESFGARHLAGAADGRAIHWRRFTECLNAADLPDEHDRQVIAGARAAFQHVQSLVGAAFAG